MRVYLDFSIKVAALACAVEGYVSVSSIIHLGFRIKTAFLSKIVKKNALRLCLEESFCVVKIFEYIEGVI